MRVYEETHPWLTFKADISRLDFRTWLLLGEAASKCQHIAGAPLRPETAKRLNSIYLTKGIHGTTSIEGNTLTESEVQKRIDGDLELPPSREYQGREIDNFVAICNDIVTDVVEGNEMTLTPERIKLFNRRIQEDLPRQEGVIPGEIRTHGVTVGGYRGAPAEDCDLLLEKMCTWLNGMVPESDDQELGFTYGTMRAILAHLYIAWIHPFGDGNGRTARLIEFQLMVQAGIPIPAAHLLSDHYNLTRDVYYIELAKTSRGDFPLQGFIRYALQGFVDELRGQLQHVRREQMEVTWENYVHSTLSGETAAPRRQKHLLLDMPTDDWVPTARLREVSGRVANDYAGKTSKTVSRDVNALVKARLLRRGKKGVIANRSLVQAFLPLSLDPNADA